MIEPKFSIEVDADKLRQYHMQAEAYREMMGRLAGQASLYGDRAPKQPWYYRLWKKVF